MKSNTQVTLSATYDSRTIWLHWLTALLVFGLWLLGQTIDTFPRGTPRLSARSFHITCGVLLAILIVIRIKWRTTQGVKLPAADEGVIGKFAIAAHYLLYLLVVFVVVVGLACVWIRGDTWFNLFTVPAYDPGNKALARNALELHGLLANSLFFLALFHAAAALWHHFFRKDGVLRRMLPKN